MLGHHWKRILGILMLFVTTAFLVPISFTCAITASESPVTHDIGWCDSSMLRTELACWPWRFRLFLHGLFWVNLSRRSDW
jgi:hypothetical protein